MGKKKLSPAPVTTVLSNVEPLTGSGVKEQAAEIKKQRGPAGSAIEGGG